jgi:hypothetical protein
MLVGAGEGGEVYRGLVRLFSRGLVLGLRVYLFGPRAKALPLIRGADVGKTTL